jgi:hypothetical protein
MAGMRDRLIHGYFGIDNEIVWKTAKEFAPEIRSEIEAILNRERSNGKKGLSLLHLALFHCLARRRRAHEEQDLSITWATSPPADTSGYPGSS